MQEQDKNFAAAPEAPAFAAQRIVSVNSRGGASGTLMGKIVFGVAVVAVVVIGSLMGFNRWRAVAKAGQAAAEQAASSENKSASVGVRRSFDTDPPPLPAGARPHGEAPALNKAEASVSPGACADGMAAITMLGADGKPMLAGDGAPLTVCRDGRVIVPGVQPAASVPLAGSAPRAMSAGGTPTSRYSGDVLVPAPNVPATSALLGMLGNSASQPNTAALLQTVLGQGQQPGAFQGASAVSNGAAGPASAASPAAANPPGSIGSLLTPSQTPMVQAGMLGDRNMILPKGRTIDCGLSMRLANEVAGMASCVLSQNVYSDNGRIVLLERGSEATGEYVATMAQGQRRLFVLWTRIKTPSGVVINLSSPAADGLGTSGVDGYVDNHWWERVGAAFLLSFVQDAIAYGTAKAADGGAGQSLAVFQNSSETGNKMAEKVLENTINIKPTLYKNQGDRGAIYVARDLDFGSVYALRAR